MTVEVFPDSDALAHAAAEAFVSAAQAAVAARGKFVVALSGGSTPKRMHHLLADMPYRERVDWGLVHILFGDDRFVPPTDGESNERMARETLLSHVPVPESQIHGMVKSDDVAADALAYEALVRDLLGEELAIDLTFLGIGPDGHTASLFPGRPSVHETERLVIDAKANMGVEDRITMTVPLLNKSREILFLVAGADKAEASQRALHGEENWDETPSQAVVRYGKVRWLTDQAS